MDRRRILLSVTAVILLLPACGGNSGAVAGPAPAVVSTPNLSEAVPGDNTFEIPEGIHSDGADLFVTDTGKYRIAKIRVAAGSVSTIAGTGSYGGVDGAGTSASFNEPAGIAGDGSNLYVVDRANHAIRKIRLSDNQTTTLSGEIGVPWDPSLAYDNVIGASAHFTNPFGVVVVGGSLYVTDSDNHTIRKIDRNSGAVSIFAGEPGVPGTDGGIGRAARFRYPKGIASDNAFLYVADSDNHLVRKVDLYTAAVTTIAGQGGVAGSNDNAVGSSAHFEHPYGIATDGADLYVVDLGNHTIRKVSLSTGAVTTIAGQAGKPGIGDGAGDAARFDNPASITMFDGKTLYVLDRNAGRIRRIALP